MIRILGLRKHLLSFIVRVFHEVMVIPWEQSRWAQMKGV